MDHAGLRELIAGGVLGGLDRSERVTVDEHLSACGACRRLDGQLSGVVMELSLCVEPRYAPPSLRRHVLTTLPVAQRGSGRRSLPAWSGRPSDWLGWAPVGLSFALAAALLVAGTGWSTVRSELEATRGLLAAATSEQSTQAAAMQVVADPAHATAWLEPSGAGFEHSVLLVYLPGSEQAYLVASRLPVTPQGRVYQFWHADTMGVHAGLTFSVTGTDVVLIPVDLDLSHAQAAMLTLEPVGGAQGKPGRDVVFGELPSS
ncbi:MAG: anti-sigma factor [Chloroflexota bacterium]|nr:anti-sigma factor [Chloroflexota bacterium]